MPSTPASIINIKFDDSGNKSPTGTNTIYDLEKKMYESLNSFNSSVADYTRCLNTKTTTGKVVTYEECSTKDRIEQTIETKRIDLDRKLTIFFNAYVSIKDSLGDRIDISSILDNYKQLLKTRNELDLKMMELNKEDNSRFVSYKSQYDSTIYNSILVTILATSLIYYIFIKL